MVEELAQKLDTVQLIFTSQIDTLWVLICTCLVFLMQGGFMCLEAGITRPKNSINIALKNITDMSVAITVFWMFGFGLMFGSSFYGIFGTEYFFFTSDFGAYQVYFLYQAVFVATATSIISGAIAERTKFEAYILIALITSGLVYPIVGHWGWASLVIADYAANADPGWLVALGFYDFAGSTIVHSVGGWIALASLIVIGPRTGRFNNTGNIKIYTSFPLAIFGIFLLWFGWFGFNGASNGKLDFNVPSIMMNTFAGGAGGLLIGVLYGYFKEKTISPRAILIAPLAGLVSITASANIIDQGQAIIIATIGTLFALKFDEVLERFEIDDIVGAVPVHLVAGIWGTIAVALFGDIDNDFFNNATRFDVFKSQLIGILSIGLFAFISTFLILKTVNKFYKLRVTASEEELGLNISEHDENTTELDLIKFLKTQIKTKDLKLRTNQDPFTNFGIIGYYVNQMLTKLEKSEKEVEMWRSRVLREINLAVEVQRNFKPERDLTQYPVFGQNIPARELSGDFFDIYPHNKDVYFIVADVAGKGINAAMVMAKSITLFEMLVGNKHDIDEVAQKINNDIFFTKTRGMFATAIIGIYNKDTEEMRFVNAGHQTPIVKLKNDSFEKIEDEKLFPLGVAEVNDPKNYQINKINLKDKRFYIYTDGLSEIFDSNGNEIGEEGIKKVLLENKSQQIKKEIEATTRALMIKSTLAGNKPGELHDDMTFVGFGK
ncbi:ammonium transporter [archaeon]|nr:ammonium transporter [archaeon]NDB79006.1 ammonium transporter [archaeon]